MTGCHISDTMKRPVVDETSKNSSGEKKRKKKANRDINELSLCVACGVPGGFVTHGRQWCCPHRCYLVKQNDMKATTI